MSSSIATLENKLAKKVELISELRSIIRYLKKRINELESSRDNWKGKNKEKQLLIRNLRQVIGSFEKAKGHQYPLSMVKLCVLLRVYGGASYRSITRILVVLKICLKIEFTRTPCANTVQNWTQKVCFSHLNLVEVKYKEQDYFLIFDESISIGRERMLLVLICPYPPNDGALKHADVDVALIASSISWRATEIEREVKGLIRKIGKAPVYILCDQANNLIKCCKLLQIPFVHDISHVLGNCLRKTLAKDPAYLAFYKLLGWYGSKGVNQDLSYLRPPKRRLKARFLNQKPAIVWALGLLKNFQTLSKKAKVFFKDLSLHLPFIHDLKSCLQLAESISICLKNNGLNKQNLDACLQLIQDFKIKGKGKPIFDRFIALLEQDFVKYQEFIQKHTFKNIQVCSDIIESLFGFYKSLLEHNKLNIVGMLSLEVVTKCLNLQQLIHLDVKKALEGISMSNINDWKSKHMTENQNIRKMIFFKNCPQFSDF